MIRLRFFVVVAVACAFASSALAAGPPDVAVWAKPRIEKGLVRPLARKEGERSRFSRAAMPPSERRVRILTTEVVRDAKGRGYVPYAIDARYGEGDDWSESYAGCVYEKTGALYVAIGDEYRSVEYLLGKKAEPVAGVCQAAPPSERS